MPLQKVSRRDMKWKSGSSDITIVKDWSQPRQSLKSDGAERKTGGNSGSSPGKQPYEKAHVTSASSSPKPEGSRLPAEEINIQFGERVLYQNRSAGLGI